MAAILYLYAAFLVRIEYLEECIHERAEDTQAWFC